jgi:anti-sigma-K factor RskA
MNCAEVNELLPAYVLGALEQDEVEALEAHLVSGNEHDDDLVELRATVFAMDRFADERSVDVVSTSAPARDERKVSQRRWGLSTTWLALPQAWRVALAAVVLLALFGGGWLGGRLTGEQAAQEVTLNVQGSGGQILSLNGETSEDHVTVMMAGLQRLPSDQVYQLWAVRGEEWVRIGTCNTNAEGGWKGDFPFQVQSGERIALTVEPAGGSERPTSEPLLISNS